MTETRNVPFLSRFRRRRGREVSLSGLTSEAADIATISPTFCVYPFKSLNITSGGGAKVCCAFMDYIAKEDRPMSVYEHSLQDIWNSENMRDIRRRMIFGQSLPGCEYCYQQERSGVESMRVAMNKTWQNEIAAAESDQASDALYEQAVKDLCTGVQASDYNMADRPEWLELDVGNLCNLKCRMCNSSSSSSIAADPVHSRWAYLGLIAARWRGAGLVIGPARVLGVASEGIGSPILENGATVGWTDGNACLRLSTDETDLAGLSIRLSGNKPDNHPLKVLVNNQLIFDGALPPGPWHGSFDLNDLERATEFELRLQSPLFMQPEIRRSVGVGIEEVKLLRKGGGKNEVITSRYPSGRLWFEDEDFLIEELLAQPEKMTRLRLIGGEPFLIKEVLSVLRHLARTGAASNIAFFTITNGTVANEEFLDLLEHFKHSIITLSFDGIKAVNDYIRFPSKWDTIDSNISRFKKLKNTYITMNMTVQAYNILNITDVIDYCFEKEIAFTYHLLQYPPHLSTAVLPKSIRNIASAQLLSYLKEKEVCKRDACATPNLPEAAAKSTAGITPNLSDSIKRLATAIAARSKSGDDHLFRDFMIFTNDMDASRNQYFAQTFPELYKLLAKAGTKWVGEKRHVG